MCVCYVYVGVRIRVCINCPAETLCSCQYVITQLISPMLEYNEYLIVELELSVETIDILTRSKFVQA